MSSATRSSIRNQGDKGVVADALQFPRLDPVIGNGKLPHTDDVATTEHGGVNQTAFPKRGLQPGIAGYAFVVQIRQNRLEQLPIADGSFGLQTGGKARGKKPVPTVRIRLVHLNFPGNFRGLRGVEGEVSPGQVVIADGFQRGCCRGLGYRRDIDAEGRRIDKTTGHPGGSRSQPRTRVAGVKHKPDIHAFGAHGGNPRPQFLVDNGVWDNARTRLCPRGIGGQKYFVHAVGLIAVSVGLLGAMPGKVQVDEIAAFGLVDKSIEACKNGLACWTFCPVNAVARMEISNAPRVFRTSAKSLTSFAGPRRSAAPDPSS